MSFKPDSSRIKITDYGSSLKITVFAEKSAIYITSRAIGVFVWLFGYVYLLGYLLSGMPIQMILMASLIWTIGGVLFLYGILWIIIGQENIRVSQESLSYQKSMLLDWPVERFDVSKIKGFKVDYGRICLKDLAHLSFWRASTYAICFTYKNESIRLFHELNEEEAKYIFDTLVERYPDLKDQK